MLTLFPQDKRAIQPTTQIITVCRVLVFYGMGLLQNLCQKMAVENAQNR